MQCTTYTVYYLTFVFESYCFYSISTQKQSYRNAVKVSLTRCRDAAARAVRQHHVCVFVRPCVFERQTTQEKEVNLQCNENANCLSCVDLHCQSASQYSIALQPLTKWLSISPNVTGTNHSAELFPSFITDKSISLNVTFFPLVHSLFLHWFLSFLHVSELFCLFLLSILSRGSFYNVHKKTGSWMGWLTISN